MINYRATPLTDSDKSRPTAELLFNRHLRTKLPVPSDKLVPTFARVVRPQLVDRQHKYKAVHDCHARDLPHYIREMLSACSNKASLLEAKSLLSTSHLGRMSSTPNVGRRHVETLVISSRQKSRGLSPAAVADVIAVADIITTIITLAVADVFFARRAAAASSEAYHQDAKRSLSNHLFP